MIDLGKRIEAEAVDHPWEMVLALPGQANQTLPSSKRIIDVFEQSSRSLLILGDPGSGKTTTLLELARELISQVEADDDFRQPIPVVFNLSTWADKQQPLEDWIVAELSSKYQIPKRIGCPWLENHRLLPLLDGLDEVKPEGRAACVEAINTFGEKVGLTGLAICSRLQEYINLPVRLKLNGAISLQPLTHEQVESYLTEGGNKLAGVRTALQADEDLQSLAKTPLMLIIMSLAYQDISKDLLKEQASGSLEERRKHLFNAYIEKMFERKGRGPLPYARNKTKAWLVWIAQKMLQHSQTIFLIERMQPSWLEQKWEYRILVVLFGLVVGLIVGSVSGLLFGLSVGLLFGLISVLIVGPSLVLFAGTEYIQPAEKLSWSWEKVKPLWKEILVLWLVSGPIAGMVIGRGDPLVDRLLFGLISGLFAGLGVGMGAGLGTSQVETITRPNQGIWLSARNALIVGLIVGSVSGLLGLLFYGARSGPSFRLIGGLGAGLSVGLLAVLFWGGNAFVQHFILRFALWRQKLLPWRLARFLDFASDLIFLRKVGGGYTFIHRYLLEHFAELES